MSGKKQTAAGVSWSTCPTCRIRCHTRNLLQKHLDLSCGHVQPMITADGLGIFELSLTDSQQSKVGQGIQLRDLDQLILLNTAFVVEMGLKTLDWVIVSKIKDGEGDQETVSICMKIWATEAGGPSYKACIHPKAAATHVALHPGKDIVSIRRIHETIPLAFAVTISIQEVPRGLSLKDVQDKLKIWLYGRVTTSSGSFRLQLFTHNINIQVHSVTFAGCVDPAMEESGLEPLARVTKETDIVVTTNSYMNKDEQKNSAEVSLEYVGGLTSEIKEVKDTIAYALTGRPRAPRGIILYGEHGTGKTLFMKAICNSLSLQLIYYQDYSETSLHELFQDTIRSERSSAIVIENIDTLSAGRRDAEGVLPFTEGLRQEMEGLPNLSRIIVIATANNPDQIDPILRTARTFAKEVELPVPSSDGRLEILQRLLRPFDHNVRDTEICKLAEDTHGFVGADLEAMRGIAFRLAGNAPPTMTHFGTALKNSRPSAMKSIRLENPHVRWDDIGGLDTLKFQLKQSVEWPLKHPEAFTRLGLTPPKGILMYGPPGCSKTMIAKALATESRLNFLSVKGSDLLSKWVGESEKAVQNLFRKVRKVAPAILFFDELDALGGERGGKGGGSNVHERVLAQLLVEIDGIEPLNDVTILAATNRPDLIDKALTRPGRLDRIIYVPLPDRSTRREILKIKMSKMPLAEDVNLDVLVDNTEGYSGAEIGGICQEAGLKALESDLSATVVRMDDFVTALTKSPPRITPALLSFYESYAKSMNS